MKEKIQLAAYIAVVFAVVVGTIYLFYKKRDELKVPLGKLNWNRRTYISISLLSLPVVFGIICLLFGAPWFIPLICLFISFQFGYISFFTSDIDRHYYVTLFGKNSGIIRSGSGLHLVVWPFFKMKTIPTEIIEGVFPGKKTEIFSNDEADLPEGMVRPYRVQSNNRDDKFQKPIVGISKPEDIPAEQVEKRKFVEKLHVRLLELYEMIDSVIIEHDTTDPLAYRLALEPRFLVKYKPLLDETKNDSEFAQQAEQFFKRFKDADDLRGNVEESTLNVLSNIFGKKLPRTLVNNQEVISEIMKLRLQYIYFDDAVDILEEGTGVQEVGVTKSVNRAIAENAAAAANKSAAILKAQGDAEATRLTNNVELEKTGKANNLGFIKIARENQLAGLKEQQILTGKAEGLKKLMAEIGAADSKDKMHAFELTVLEKVLPETDLTVISGQDGGGLADIGNLLTKKLVTK